MCDAGSKLAENRARSPGICRCTRFHAAHMLPACCLPFPCPPRCLNLRATFFPDTLTSQSTGSGSALKTVRETELYGGVLSAGLSREYLYINAEFLRGDE